MFNYKIEENKVVLGETEMNYVAFGRGTKPLVLLPGLSESFVNVKGQGFNLASYYKQYCEGFRVYVFSRKNQLEEGCTTRAMARDQMLAFEQLGIQKAYVMGISQGGMIAQYLAIDYPGFVERLVLGVSVSKQNATLQRVIKGWIEMAKASNYKALIVDTMVKTYTEKKMRKYRPFLPIISRIGKPKSMDRFLIQAHACLSHNAYEELDKIQCPVLVIGGDQDFVAGPNSSEEMAQKIPGSRLVAYRGLGHGAFEEAKDFNQVVIDFLKEQITEQDDK